MNPNRRSSRLRPFRPLPALLLAGALFAQGCASSAERDTTLARIEDAAHHGRFEEAVRLADQLRAERPGDERAVEAHRLATVGLYLDRGREATFNGEDLEALAWFRDALEIAPENPLVGEWIRKTRNKIASVWMRTAQELYASEELEEALDAYHKALEYNPDDKGALEGLGQLTILVNYRNGLGVQYYNEGVRALAGYWLQQAKRGFTATRKYLPENDRAERRITEVDTLLAGQRVFVADGLEAEGFYAGALNEYRLALVLDPGSEEAKAGIARLTDEAAAAQFLREARMRIYRGEFNRAAELLDEGEKLTELQKELFRETREEVTGARLQRMYDAALNLEHDQRYEEAIQGYAHLLTQVDFFKDARARMETLESYVAEAAGYYEEASNATDPTQQLLNLRAIEGFWPDYRDIQIQIRELEGKLGKGRE